VANASYSMNNDGDLSSTTLIKYDMEILPHRTPEDAATVNIKEKYAPWAYYNNLITTNGILYKKDATA